MDSMKNLFLHDKTNFPNFAPPIKKKQLCWKNSICCIEGEENSHTKLQETLGFKTTKPKHNFNFDKHLNIPEKKRYV